MYMYVCMCVYIPGEFENELEREALKATLLPASNMQRSDWHHANYVFAMLLDFECHPHNKTESWVCPVKRRITWKSLASNER